MASGIYSGKHRVSYRKRVEQYCNLHRMQLERGFGENEVRKVVLIDFSIERRPLFLRYTFDREVEAFRFL